MNNKRVVTSVKELKTIIKKTQNSSVIKIKNLSLKFPFTSDCFTEIQGAYIKGNKRKSVIDRQFKFENVDFLSLELYNLKFKKRFLISSSTIYNLWINHCMFCNSFSIMNFEAAAVSKLEIKNSYFKKDVIVKLSNQTQINVLSVEGTHFKGDVCISGVNTVSKEDFAFYIAEGTKIDGSLTICNSTIFSNTKISCIIKNNLQLENINSNVLKYFSKYAISGNLNIFKSKICKLFSLKNCAFNIVGISDSIISDISEDNFYYTVLTEDTARIFSSSPTMVSDPIKKEKYLAELFDRKLKDNIKETILSIIHHLNKKNNFKRYKQNIKPSYWKRSLKNIKLFLLSFITSLGSGNKFILFFNKYSNNFNRSWFRGIVFTNIVAIICFFLINYFGTNEPFFCIDWTFSGFSDVLREYIRLLDVFGITNLEDKKGINSETALNGIGTALLFVARIFISYGCWQTIYAFYKFQKH